MMNEGSTSGEAEIPQIQENQSDNNCTFQHQGRPRNKSFKDKFSRDAAKKSADKSKNLRPHSFAQITQLNVIHDMRNLKTSDYIRHLVQINRTTRTPTPSSGG